MENFARSQFTQNQANEEAWFDNGYEASYRIWRAKDERFLKSTIRPRWKGYSEFMFWGCFTYDTKGPCHCWLPETKTEKSKAVTEIAAMNEKLEPVMREQWELESGMSRLGLRGPPGRKPQWKWDVKHGKLERSFKGGIDWYRYQTKILIPKLFPLAKECMQSRPATVVQEDKAPSHAHHYQEVVYNLSEVKRLLWCGNSPDLNPIEPCWPWMKRSTTKKGAPESRAEGIRRWEATWKELPQEKIQAWIERILHNSSMTTLHTFFGKRE